MQLYGSMRASPVICLVTSHAPSAVHFRGHLISLLVSKGCRVIVLAPNHSLYTKNELHAMGATIEYFPMSPRGISPFDDLHSLCSLYSLFKRLRPNVVFTYFVKPNIWGILAAALARVPRRIAMVEGMGFAFTANSSGIRSPQQILVSWFILFLYRISFSFAQRVVVLNNEDKFDLHRLCGLSNSKAYLLGGIGVPLDKIRISKPVSSPFTFTMVSRILKEKGVFEFLNAADAIHAEFPDVRFLLLGSIDNKHGSIEKKDLDPWLLKNYIYMPGHVDVMPWLELSSVFVLPSYYREGVPLSTQEAMAMGLPVITTNVPGCRDTVINDLNGFLIQPFNTSALVAAMRRFILEPELSERMGLESRHLAECRYDVKVQCMKLMVLFCL